jgi:hypothetical protein
LCLRRQGQLASFTIDRPREASPVPDAWQNKGSVPSLYGMSGRSRSLLTNTNSAPFPGFSRCRASAKLRSPLTRKFHE